jgi:hypothetical protein
VISVIVDRNNGIARSRRSLIVEPRQRGESGGALLQRFDQRAVLDIVAEHFEADFLASEPDLGCPD